MPSQKFENYYSYAKTALLMREPFFGTLMLSARVQEVPLEKSPPMATAWTDGLRVYFCETFVDSLDKYQFTGVLLHEVLHMAWCHVQRCKSGTYKPLLWNFATDYVINLVIHDSSNASTSRHKYTLPEGALLDEQYRDMSADAVYHKLLKEMTEEQIEALDALSSGMFGSGSGGEDGEDGNGNGGGYREVLEEVFGKDSLSGDLDTNGSKSKGANEGSGDSGNPIESAAQRQKQLEEAGRNWTQVVAEAATIAKMQGKLPAGAERHVKELIHPKVDWQTLLRRFVQQFPIDYSFAETDRRFCQSPFIIPTMQGETVEITVAVDTSGSFSMDELRHALSETFAILKSYDGIKMTVMSCDAAVHTVQEVTSVADFNKIDLKGGGGTDFRKEFKKVDEMKLDTNALIYFTDLYGTFPKEEPTYPTIWIVMGNDNPDVPFGEVYKY